MKYALLLAGATGALASLNCSLTAMMKTYCCPDTGSEVVKEVPEGGLVMLGCAADNTDKKYYWNYNGLYTPYSEDVVDCVLNADPYDDMKVLPDCAIDDFVLDLTEGGSGPLDECNPNCVSEEDFPADTYFGDKQEGVNMAEDFPVPETPEEGDDEGGGDNTGEGDGEAPDSYAS